MFNRGGRRVGGTSRAARVFGVVAAVFACGVVHGCDDGGMTTALPPPYPPNGATECALLSPNGDTNVTDLDWAGRTCLRVEAGAYSYRNVVVGAGQELRFVEPAAGNADVKFYAASILVERGGKLVAGTTDAPYGALGSTLTFGLWGADPAVDKEAPPPIACAGGRCYPDAAPTLCCTGKDPSDPCSEACTPGGENAAFEAYAAIGHAHGAAGAVFGSKVLAVGYGGRLQLLGQKGVARDRRTTSAELVADAEVARKAAPTCAAPSTGDPQDWANPSGESWARLGADAVEGAAALTLDRAVGWKAGDKVVVATSDWHRGHTEVATLAADAKGGALALARGLTNAHRGTLYEPTTASARKIDLRAPVGLLSRSIRIESRGAKPNEPFPEASACGYAAPDAAKPPTNPNCYFGGHVMARQGFGQFQVQGVELHQLGQGGRMGSYPVHFHAAKDTRYTQAFLRDSAVWDSMTRFVTLHATHGVAVERNVGFLSVGHGFYLEDGSEIDNALCFNLGLSTRPAYEETFRAHARIDADGAMPPEARRVPAILYATSPGPGATQLGGSDTLFPSTFWIMNAANEFVGNHAAGVGGFGACYWLPGAGVSGLSQGMKWAYQEGVRATNGPRDYASWNRRGERQAPLVRFSGNTCATAEYALMTELSSVPPSGASPVTPFDARPPDTGDAGTADGGSGADAMLPLVQGNFNPVRHRDAERPATCSSQALTKTDLEANATFCLTTIVDRFTTSFNWAETNVGSVWLRPKSYVFLNGAVTDQLFGGLGFVSGGSWDQAGPEYFTITKDSLFVGSTRPAAPGQSYVEHEAGPAISDCHDGWCFLPEDGVALPTGAFNPQRLITIYDGPFFSDGSVFEHIRPLDCPVAMDTRRAQCGIYSTTNQPVKAGTSSTDASVGVARVMNAGIGWKQPNAFYYPPAFAFRNSAFGDKADVRHNVLDASQLYWQGQSDPRAGAVAMNLGSSALATGAGVPAAGLTPIDFMTILNDLDGTLNGLTRADGAPRTAGLSNNLFYRTPVGAPQCASFGTETTTADFVTTAVAKLAAVPASGADGTIDGTWSGTSPIVPIYRQLTLPEDTACARDTVCNGSAWGCSRASLLMGAYIGQAPGLVVSGGTYFLDTFSGALNGNVGCFSSGSFQPATFTAGSTYLVYHLFGKAETATTYQIYVGPSFTTGLGQWVRVKPHLIDGGNMRVVTDAAAHGSASVAGGVLTVTLDHKNVDYGFHKDDALACAPRDLCAVAGDGCTASARFDGDPRRAQIASICSTWVERKWKEADGTFLADCPADGCIGYAFTLPADFAGTGSSGKGYSTIASVANGTPYPNAPPWTTALADPKGSGCATHR